MAELLRFAACCAESISFLVPSGTGFTEVWWMTALKDHRELYWYSAVAVHFPVLNWHLLFVKMILRGGLANLEGFCSMEHCCLLICEVDESFPGGKVLGVSLPFVCYIKKCAPPLFTEDRPRKTLVHSLGLHLSFIIFSARAFSRWVALRSFLSMLGSSSMIWASSRWSSVSSESGGISISVEGPPLLQ